MLLALVLYRHRLARLALVLLAAPPTAGATAGAAATPTEEHLVLSRVVVSSGVAAAPAAPGVPHRQRRVLVLQRVVDARRPSPRLVLVLLGIALGCAPARDSHRLVLVLLCTSPRVVEAAHRVVQARASHRQRRLMLVLQRVVEARRASPRLVLVLLGIALVSAPARGSLVLVLLCASPQQQLLLPLHRVVEAVVEAAQLLLPLHRVVEAVVEAAHRVVEASHRLMLLLLAAPPQIFWFCWWKRIAVILSAHHVFKWDVLRA